MKARIIAVQEIRAGDLFTNAQNANRLLMNITLETTDGHRGKQAMSVPKNYDEHSHAGQFWLRYGSIPKTGMEVEVFLSGKYPRLALPAVVPYQKKQVV
jgi:hypothetical protein